MAKKFYESMAGERRVAAVFSPEQFKKLLFLQLQYEMPEKEVILTSVDEMYVRSIEKSAVETGLLKSSALTLSRDDFNDDALFDSICLRLNVFGPDGKVETVKQLSLDVSKVFISEVCEKKCSQTKQIPKEKTF